MSYDYPLLRANYGPALWDELVEILYQVDPLRIGSKGDNPNHDAYDSNVATLIPQLKPRHSPENVRWFLHQEIIRWFWPEFAGPEERYEEAAQEIWAIWQRYL